jgi:hypothetical protein
MMLISRGIFVLSLLVTASSAVIMNLRGKKFTPTHLKNLFQGGNATRQKMLELIKKLGPIVERMKFSGDEIKSVVSSADEIKKPEAPTEDKITPAAFAQGKLKHFFIF